MDYLFYFIIFCILGIVAYFLFTQVQESRAQGRPFWHFGDYTLLAWSLIALSLSFALFNIFPHRPSFDDPEKAIRYGERTNQPWLSAQGYRALVEMDGENPDHHYGWISKHFSHGYAERVADVQQYDIEGTAIFSHYTQLSENGETSAQRDIGNLGLGLYYMFRELPQTYADFGMARSYFERVENKELKYRNYGIAMCMLYDFGAELAEPHFNEEIRLEGFKAGAWNRLGWIYDFGGRTQELRELISEKESRRALDFNLLRKFYYQQADLLSFYGLYFGTKFDTLDWFGTLGALFVLLIWLVFLHRVGFIVPLRGWQSALCVGIGFLAAMLAWIIYAFYEYTLKFELNGEILNDALYCFLGIGLIEEVIKLIPFLVILYFTDIIKKPIHYIMVACFSALGFAFFENLLYISQDGLSVIHARALMAAVAHMVSSALIAYGFILGRYRYPGKLWLWVPLMFLISVLAHGFYDFWLLNAAVRRFFLLTFLFYLSEVLVFASILNNALNQSVEQGTPERQLELKTGRLTSLLSGGLVLVFLFEFMSLCLVYGTEYGNKTLFSGFISGGYLIFFLSMRLPNIDIVPGEWAPIEFFTGLLPSHFASRKLNLNSVVGLELEFHALARPGPLRALLPRKGQVIRREKLGGYSGWFVVQLSEPLQLGGQSHPHILIRAKNKSELISNESPVIVAFCLFPQAGGKYLFMDWAIAK